MFTTILAESVKIILPIFIDDDQCGLSPKRQLKENVRIVFDILEYLEQDKEKQITLNCLDADKTFENSNLLSCLNFWKI